MPVPMAVLHKHLQRKERKHLDPIIWNAIEYSYVGYVKKNIDKRTHVQMMTDHIGHSKLVAILKMLRDVRKSPRLSSRK